MIEMNLKEGDRFVSNPPFYMPNLIKELENVRTINFVEKDSKALHSFLEFDSLHSMIYQIEEFHKNHDTPRLVAQSHHNIKVRGNDDWRYGKELLNREKTFEYLDLSLVTEETWKAIDFLRNSLLKDEEINRLMELAPSIKKQRKFGTSGDELDIDRVLAGDPQHWQYSTPGKKSNIVRIFLDTGMSAGNGGDEFIKLTALAAVASDLIVKSGASLEILAGNFSKGVHNSKTIKDLELGDIKITNASYSGSLFYVKKAEESFDINKVASLSAPGLFRHYLFFNKILLGPYRAEGGLGMAIKPSKDFYKKFGFDHVLTLKWTSSDSQQRVFLSNIFKELAGELVPEGV